MAIFMEYEGVKGDVTAKGFEGMISLKAIEFKVTRKISMKAGEMANRENSAPKFSVFKTWGFFDSSTIHTLKESFAGSTGKQVNIYIVKTAKDGLEPILTYTLDNCLPTYYNILITGRDGCIPPEKLFLSYTAIRINQGKYDASNKKNNMMRLGYDLTTAKKL